MIYIFFSVLIAFLLYPIVSAKAQLSDDKKNKPFTSVTTLMGIAVFISIIISISISSNADMSSDIGYGGFFYIIEPALLGILVLLIYLIGIKARPDWKFTFGNICIIINVIIGFVYLFK